MTRELIRETIIQNGKPVERYSYAEWFTYRASVTNLGPGNDLSDTITLQAGSEFVLERLTTKSDIAGAAQNVGNTPIPNVLVQITDTGEGKNLFAEPIEIGALFGDGRLPFILPIQRRFFPAGVISVSFTSFEAAVTYANLAIVFSGYKSYQAS